MRDKTIDVLLQMGVPASIKGFTYICDAIELFDTDPYYPDGKICSLYFEIARLHETTASRVERAIRHAFEVALTKGFRKGCILHLYHSVFFFCHPDQSPAPPSAGVITLE